MSLSVKKIPNLVLLILVVIGLYIAYQILVFLVKLFVYLGYNTIFYLDNLLEINPFNPIINWTFLGLVIGSIVGVIVAVKKFKLSKLLILYPIGFLSLFVLIMGLVNKPAQYSTYVNEPYRSNDYTVETPAALPTFSYIAKQDVNVRQAMNTSSPIVVALKKGQRVDVVENGIIDGNRTLWARVRYNGLEGYARIKYFKKDQ